MWKTCAACARPGPEICAFCAQDLRPDHGPRFDAEPSVLAAFAYSGTARDLILGLKLRHRRRCAEPLADGITARVMRTGLEGDLVTWVPGRRADIRIRGFDHAEVLARAVARRLGLRSVPLLRRLRDSIDQSGLDRLTRASNVSGAFASVPVTEPVVLVDDLVTTGATASSCSGALLEAGATGVEILVAARA